MIGRGAGGIGVFDWAVSSLYAGRQQSLHLMIQLEDKHSSIKSFA